MRKKGGKSGLRNGVPQPEQNRTVPCSGSVHLWWMFPAFLLTYIVTVISPGPEGFELVDCILPIMYRHGHFLLCRQD